MIGLNVAVSGLNAAEKRLDAAAANIVNARDTAPTRAPPVQPVAGPSASPPQDDGLYRPVDVWQSTVEGGGTKAQYVEREPSRTTEFAPAEPMANSEGLVDHPNVGFSTEFVDMMLARRAYEAALKAVQVGDEMLGTTIDARS